MSFEHQPHPHARARKAGEVRPVRTHEQRTEGKSTLGRVGGVVGLRITLVVGTMTCATAFTLLALVSLPAAIKTGDKIVIVAWIAQTFIQLVLLPIIIVGQNIQAKASDKRAEQTYLDAEAVLHEAREIQRHLADQDAALAALAVKPRSRVRKATA